MPTLRPLKTGSLSALPSSPVLPLLCAQLTRYPFPPVTLTIARPGGGVGSLLCHMSGVTCRLPSSRVRSIMQLQLLLSAQFVRDLGSVCYLFVDFGISSTSCPQLQKFPAATTSSLSPHSPFQAAGSTSLLFSSSPLQ